jgi:hypothetical protein
MDFTMNWSWRLVALLVALSSAGCTTLGDVVAAKGTGSTRIYDKPYDVVWAATVDTIKSSSLLGIVSENKTQGVILAQRGASVSSLGENVAVFIEAKGDNRTSVEVVSKRAMILSIFVADWEHNILSELDRRL